MGVYLVLVSKVGSDYYQVLCFTMSSVIVGARRTNTTTAAVVPRVRVGRCLFLS